ncbi:MAG: DUF255 domain-containing protein, partial [Pirellulaceae bacterium]|nr:DUF255 domain-containing protein [Pirellulaceae bacterium]
MRTVALRLLPIAAFVVVSINTATAEIPWQTNLRTAHAKAQAEGKLLLLHFFSDNCVWCDRLEAGAFQSAEVSQAVGNQFVPVKIHGGKNPQLTEMFKVTAFPTDVIVTTKGDTLVHSVSPQQPNRYIAMLAGALGNTAAAAPEQRIAEPPSTAPDLAQNAPPQTAQAPPAKPPVTAAPTESLAMQLPVQVRTKDATAGPQVNNFVANEPQTETPGETNPKAGSVQAKLTSSR